MIDFFEFSNEMLCLANRQGYFIRVNRAWARTLGWSLEEIMSRPYVEFVHPEDLEATVREAALLQSGRHETIRFENRYLCKDGSYKWLAWHAKLEPDSNQVVAAARDVTKQKHQAEALRESEERFRHLVTHAPVGIFLADLQGNCLFVNDSWCAMSGLSSELALGEGWRTAMHPCDQARIYADWSNAVRRRGEYIDEGRFLKPNGEIVWIEMAAAPYSLGAEHPVSYIGTTVDITERVEAMANLTAEQDLLRQSLELQDRERKLIAYDIHDGLIQYATGALWHVLGYQSTVVSQENIELLESGIAALRQTVAEGRRVMNGIRTPVLDEHGVVASIEEFVLERRTENTDIEFIPPKNAIGRLAAEREIAIYRMVQEGVNNALKHSQSPKVRVSLERANECIQLVVKDWGVGFEIEEPARGVHGLLGIKERVRLLNGTFHLESSPGQGTCIEIELPLPKPLPETNTSVVD
jgi:PAS domain S-box-containing protein